MDLIKVLALILTILALFNVIISPTAVNVSCVTSMLFCLLVGFWAEDRGRVFWHYYVLSFMLTPVVGLIVLLIKKDLTKCV